MKNFTFKVPIYNFDVSVSTETTSKAKVYFKSLVDNSKNVDEFINGKYKACTVDTIKNGILVHLLDKSIPVITHEAFHVVEFILATRVIPHCDNTSEVYALLIQFIVEQILLNLKK